MKCPKCGYIGFEAVDRCRNCGYEFSLAPPLQVPDLPMRDEDARDERPLGDLSLVDQAVSAEPPAPHAHQPDPVRTLAGLGTPPRRELPFGDEPLITKPSPPRPPLAVRRATPEVPRLRSQNRMPMLDLAQVAEPESVGRPGADSPQAWPSEGAELEAAGLVARALAVSVDLAILFAIDAIVVYFTMKICGLTAADFSVLPKGPLLVFLIVQNGGYFVAFTAGGQTLGKMIAGIKVISDGGDAPLDVGRSVLRTLVWVVLAFPAGLGFLTILGGDHRGLHDRCAGTRVVRLPA